MNNIRYVKDILNKYKFAKVQNLNIKLELQYSEKDNNEDLKKLYKNNQIIINKINAGLSELNQYELNIINELYLNNTPITNKELYKKLGLSNNAFYKYKNKIINKFMMKAFPIK